MSNAKRSFTKKEIARFTAKVEKRKPSQCWYWLPSKAQNVHGHFYRENGPLVGAHRIAYELVHGPIPHGLWIIHSCDTPSCVNPRHLRAGTPSDNTQDMVAKGRANRAHGEQHYIAKLSDQQIRLIRASYRTQQDLAKEFGVSRAAIGYVKNKVTWKHVI